jgi:hypothetical protein
MEIPQQSSHNICGDGATRRTHVNVSETLKKKKIWILRSKLVLIGSKFNGRLSDPVVCGLVTEIRHSRVLSRGAILLVAHHKEVHDILLAKLHGHTKHSEHEVM